MWTRESLLCARIFLCRFLIIQLYSGEGIYIFKGCIYPILPVTNTQTFWSIIKTDKTKSKTLEKKRKVAMHLLFHVFLGYIKNKTGSQSVSSQAGYFIFSGFFPPPQLDSLSWFLLQLLLCNHMGSYACQSNGEVHKISFHIGSQILYTEKEATSLGSFIIN